LRIGSSLFIRLCYNNLGMEKPKYEIVEHTADVALRIYGRTLEDLFGVAGEALFEIIGACRQRNRTIRRTIEIEADGLEDLFHDWLSELNYLHQTRREVYFDFHVLRLNDRTLEAAVSGEPIDPERHKIDREIKAVTYHRLSVERAAEGWQAFVIFDI